MAGRRAFARHAARGRHVFGTVKVGERGQIVIPEEARELFGIRPGDTLLVLGDEKNGLLATPPDVMHDVARQILSKSGGRGESGTERRRDLSSARCLADRCVPSASGCWTDCGSALQAVDRIAEADRAKVLAAMQKNRVSAACFAATTGYGYDDVGRDKLERVYADTFHTEAALARRQITCGTHALTVALSANLLPGDELLWPVGAPYDTLEEVIGIRPVALLTAGIRRELPAGGPEAGRHVRL